MKRTILAILSLCALPIVSFAQRGILLGLPHDDPNARRDVYRWVELKPFTSEYDQIIKTRIGSLKGEGITKVFGPKLEQHSLMRNGDPTNSIAPLFAPYSLSFSGLLEGEDKSHRDLFALGNIGYVEFFYERDDSFKTAVLYAHLDDKFVPLKSTNDFSKRLEWDKTKWDALRQWLHAHAVPVNDAKIFSPTEATEAAASQEPDLLHFAWGGGMSNIKTAEVWVAASGKVTTRYEKQSQRLTEYAFSLNKDEIAALVESVRKVKFFDQPSDDTTFATDTGNSSITVNIGNDRRTVNYRYRPELGPLSQKVWELVEQGIITSELEQNGDVYPAMVASSPYLVGAKVYCPRLLVLPLKTNISLCADSQKLEWGLTGLAWLLTSDQWLNFVSEQIEKASAERQVLLLRVLKSHPFTGNIPPVHARELVALLNQIKEPERSTHTPR